MPAPGRAKPFFFQNFSAPTARWASAHGPMGDRPWGDGRTPMGRWARAHGPMGADFLGDKNGNVGFRNGQVLIASQHEAH